MQQMICDITEPADPLGTGSLRLWDSLRDRNISIPLGAFSVDFCAFNKPADFYDTVTGEFKNFANVPPAGFRWLHQVPPAGFTRCLPLASPVSCGLHTTAAIASQSTTRPTMPCAEGTTPSLHAVTRPRTSVMPMTTVLVVSVTQVTALLDAAQLSASTCLTDST